MDKCEVCEKPGPMVVVAGGEQVRLCSEHFDLYWNRIPQLVAMLVILLGGKAGE